MSLLGRQRLILALLDYVDARDPGMGARIGGDKSDPLLWLPAPNGYAVWVQVQHGSYFAVISRRIPPEALRNRDLGRVRAHTAATAWRAASAWFAADPELSAAWKAHERPTRAEPVGVDANSSVSASQGVAPEASRSPYRSAESASDLPRPTDEADSHGAPPPAVSLAGIPGPEVTGQVTAHYINVARELRAELSESLEPAIVLRQDGVCLQIQDPVDDQYRWWWISQGRWCTARGRYGERSGVPEIRDVTVTELAASAAVAEIEIKIAELAFQEYQAAWADNLDGLRFSPIARIWDIANMLGDVDTDIEPRPSSKKQFLDMVIDDEHIKIAEANAVFDDLSDELKLRARRILRRMSRSTYELDPSESSGIWTSNDLVFTLALVIYDALTGMGDIFGE